MDGINNGTWQAFSELIQQIRGVNTRHDYGTSLPLILCSNFFHLIRGRGFEEVATCRPEAAPILRFPDVQLADDVDVNKYARMQERSTSEHQTKIYKQRMQTNSLMPI